jgi:OmpA-OmpF porin, OOP family
MCYAEKSVNTVLFMFHCLYKTLFLMKNIFTFLFCLSVLCTLSAQNPKYKNGISFKKLFLDYQSQNGGSIDAFKDYHHGFEIGYNRNLGEKLQLVVPFKFGTVAQFNTSTNKSDDCLHKQVAGLDAQLQYIFTNAKNNIVPYLMAGVGGVQEFQGDFNAQVPFGVGINFKAASNAYINIQSEYRYSFATNRNNLQHGIGFTYLWGGSGEEIMEEKKDDMSMDSPKDQDKDGIEDKLDLCPDIPGLKAMNGCPDSDLDSVADFQDSCPNTAGSKDLKGCPDTDNDGVADNVDNCPNLAGPAANKGCPLTNNDTDNDGVPNDKDKCPDFFGSKDNDGCPLADKDGDGVADKADRCPDVKGITSLGGCPDKDNDGIADPDDKCPSAAGPKVYNGCPDSDGDGLNDSIDKCPHTAGTVASNGCPDIAIEDKRTLDVAMRAVQFETGKATLKAESYIVLKQIANILNRYPDYNLAIAGHTDNTGSSVANQDLSEKRAKACHDYLITQKVDPSRLSHAGYGESRPVSDNASENGRTLNRRVEFNLNPR